MLGNGPRFWDGWGSAPSAGTMSLWEYKVISSGKGGFATPALLEKFLNDLGREEWEIIEFRTSVDNALAFSGLARRSTQRDWTLEDAAAAAAKAEAEKLRAEFEAKFKAATTNGPSEERAPSFLEEKVAPDDGFRKPVDTSRDDEPDAPEDEAKDEWDKLTESEDDDLPTFFDAIKPHMRRNQRGPGMSVGVDYLAKKWDQSEDDLKGALVECGFVIPPDEDAKPEYLEYDGDLYWLNINRRGELWINTKEKPRPVFRPVKAQKVVVEEPAKPERPQAEPKPENQSADAAPEKPERPEKSSGKPAPQESDAPAAPLPEGPALLDKIRPHMRRNRRGPGGSGSTTFLSRALRCKEADLGVAFQALGLSIPTSPSDKPVYVEIGGEVWWLNLDSRGGLWINGREKRAGETTPTDEAEPKSDRSAESAPGAAGPDGVPSPELAPAASVEAAANASGALIVAAESAATSVANASATRNTEILASLRSRLSETRTGAFAASIDRLAEATSNAPDTLVSTLVEAGLKVPEKPREKPVFVERDGEVFWLNRNAKDELWLNAKPSKDNDRKEAGEGEESGGGESEEDGDKKPRRGRSRKR